MYYKVTERYYNDGRANASYEEVDHEIEIPTCDERATCDVYTYTVNTEEEAKWAVKNVRAA